MSDQLKICIVKQNSCYDLYTQTGPNARAILESSNMRTGPIGLWEFFDCSFKVVCDYPEEECQLGQRLWNRYTQGWNYNRSLIPESVEDIDWTLYHIVISVDVSIPSRTVRKFPDIMWCYYFIEGGPLGIDTLFRGSPFFGYNVFLNQRLAKAKLTFNSKEVLSIFNSRRTALDFPYYILSSTTIKNLYPEITVNNRQGITLSHHSYSVISSQEKAILSGLGELYDNYNTISDIHRLELRSKYFIVHPHCKGMAGLALIEAISAGCLVIAPKHLIWGFPELISDAYDYNNFSEMIDIIKVFESDSSVYDRECKIQSSKIDEWCFVNPISNLKVLYNSFKGSPCSLQKQYIHEKISVVKSYFEKLIRYIW